MTEEIRFRSDMDVVLLANMADDESVIRAAKVSTEGAEAIDLDALDQDIKESLDDVDRMTDSQRFRFIWFLLSNRHGSPFEHAVFRFYVSAPLFVFREFQRHRTASYNEESGRYKVMDPVFYIPSRERKLVQVGRTGEYRFEAGSDEQYDIVVETLRDDAERGWANYQRRLEAGVAKEVSRMGLPLHLYSSMWVTLNARSIMNFLSLRVKDEDSMFPSYPQREIEMTAEIIEQEFAKLMPLTHRAFTEAKRVTP